MQLGFGPFYVFYTLHLQAQGHDGFAVGVLWAIGVLCEIVMFWVAPRLVQRYGAHRLMTACIAATVVRWSIVAHVRFVVRLDGLAQTGHALSFAAFHAGCMRRMAELFPQRRDMAAAQGMLYGFSGGIGGVAGAAWRRWHGNWAAARRPSWRERWSHRRTARACTARARRTGEHRRLPDLIHRQTIAESRGRT